MSDWYIMDTQQVYGPRSEEQMLFDWVVRESMQQNIIELVSQADSWGLGSEVNPVCDELGKGPLLLHEKDMKQDVTFRDLVRGYDTHMLFQMRRLERK